MSVEKEQLKSLIKELVGVERAEIMSSVEKAFEKLTAQYGSLAAAKAAGEQTDFAIRENVDGARDRAAKAADAGVAPKFLAGRMLRALAANRGDVERCLANAKASKDFALTKAFEATMAQRQKAMQYSDFSAGGALVPEDFSSEVIDLLYPSLTVMSLGASTLPMPNGNMTLPFLDSGVTAYYMGEVANITPSQQATGQIEMRAHKLAAVVPISNDLLRTASARADAHVQKDLLMRLKVRADLAFLRGTGADGQPKGVRNWAPSGNVFAQSGTTLADKVADLGKLIRLVQEGNVPLENCGYIFSPRTEWGLKNTLDSLGNYIFRPEMAMGMLNGFAYRSSTAVPNTLSTDKSEIVFGAFAHVIVGESGSVEVSAHPDGAYHDGSAVQSGVSSDVTPIRAIVRHDLACRFRGAEIAVQTGTSWS